MKKCISAYLTIFCLIGGLTQLIAQTGQIQGTLTSPNEEVDFTQIVFLMDELDVKSTIEADGRFIIKNVPYGAHVIKAINGEDRFDRYVQVAEPVVEIGKFQVYRASATTIATIDLGNVENLEDDEQDISGLLSASNDLFLNTAAFTWSAARFRVRGLDSENTDVMLNGVTINNADDGRVFYNAFGGLNEVTRNREFTQGNQYSSIGFGGMGGSLNYDLKARNQRKQSKIAYANSNRSYRHRVMGTYSTGLMANGWAISASGSRRMAQEGFVEGTPYDAYSGFLSIDRKINEKNYLSLTAFGAFLERGFSNGATQEIYDLVGSNFYNANWGFINGEKRNARVGTSFQPTFILTHDLELNNRASLSTSVYFHDENSSRTRIDWANGRNPDAAYYQKLPSFQADPYTRELTRQVILDDPSVLQVDWQSIYQSNAFNQQTRENVTIDGVQGQSISDLESQYVLSDEHSDSRQFAISSTYNKAYDNGDLFMIRGQAQQTKQHYYRTIEDLLGGEFYVDLDRFLDADEQGRQQSDLRNPNRVVEEGDTYGWDYDIDITSADLAARRQWTGRHIDFHLGAQVGYRGYQRDGAYQNGLHPRDTGELVGSFGKSLKLNFLTWSGKTGLTYKISGRQYIYANAGAQSRAPFARFSFVDPRQWNQTVPDLDNELILSGDIGYEYRSTDFSLKAIGYINQFYDGTRSFFFFNDAFLGLEEDAESDGVGNDFVNQVEQKIDRRSVGVELAADYNIPFLPGLKVFSAASLLQNRFTDNSQIILDLDAVDGLPEERLKVFKKGYKVSGTPEKAISGGFTYNAPQFWWVRLTGSYYDGIYYDVANIRNTQEFYDNQVITETDPLLPFIRDQAEGNSAFMLDFFGGKTFRWGDYFVALTVGVNNLLDKRDFSTGGFEQSRWRTNASTGEAIFGPRIFYGYGRNYFAQVSVRF